MALKHFGRCCLYLTLAATPCRAADVTSTLIGSGAWTNNAIWNSALYPDNGNGGLSYDASVDFGTVTLSGELIEFEAFTLTLAPGWFSDSAAVSGSGTLTFAQASTWSSGVLAGPTDGSGTLTLGGPGVVTLCRSEIALRSCTSNRETLGKSWR